MNIKKLLAGGVVAALAFMVNAGFAQTINDAELDDAITHLYENGQTSYDNQADFMPMGNLTREQTAKFVAPWASVDLCLEPSEDAVCTFDDLPADPSLDEYVVLACEMGMVKGSNGMYYPTNNITKAEFLTVIVRAVRAAAGEDPLLDESVSPRWNGYYDEAKELGLTKETDVWALDRSITRYEAALILYRARIDEPVCTDVDWTEWLEDVLVEDDTDAVVEDEDVYNGTLSASLDPETPEGTTVPGLATVHVASFDIQADEAAELQSLFLERLGLGNNDSIEEISLGLNGAIVSKTKDFDDDGTVEIDLSDKLMLEDAEMVTIDIFAKIGDEDDASNQEFAIALIGLNGEEFDDGVVAEEFRVGGVNATNLIVELDNDDTDSAQVGDDDAEFARFSLENTDDDYNVYITSITLEDDENNMDDALENFTLEWDGDVIATVASVDDEFLTFVFDEPFVIEDGETEDFEVHASVIAGVGDDVDLFINEENYIVGYDGNFMYGLDVTKDDTNSLTVTIEAGEVALEEIHLDIDEIREDRKDNVIAAFDMTFNAGSEVNLDEMHFDFDWNAVGGSAPALIFEDIELHIAGESEDVENIGLALDFEDLDWDLESGVTYRAEIVAETADDLIADGYEGTNFNITFDANCGVDSCDDIDLEDADGEKIVDITPETLDLDTVTIVAPGVSVSDLSMSDVDVVIGSTLVDFLQFQVETDDVAGATFKALTLDNGLNFDEDHVEAVTLWKQTANGWVELDSESGNDIDTPVTLNDFDVDIPMATTQIFMLTVDVTSDESNLGDVNVQLTEMDIEDDENDDVDVSGDLPLVSRTVTINGAGTLSVAFDANTDVDDDMYILGGQLSDYVAAYELSAEDEDVSVQSLSLWVNGDADDFVDSVYKVYLYDEDGTELYVAPVGSDVATNGGEVTFNNLSPELVISSEENTILYVALETKKMGNGGTADVYGTTDFTFGLEATDAEGITSNADLSTGNVAGEESNNVAVFPVLVSDVSLTDYDNSELTSAFQTIGTFSITADTWNANELDSTSDATLGLGVLTLDCSAVNAVDLELVADSGESVTGTCAAGTVEFDFSAGSFSESDVELDAGETEEFTIKLDGSYTPVDGDSISLEFDTNNHSSLTYGEAVECPDTGDSCVPELRLGTSAFGTAEASNSN